MNLSSVEMEERNAHMFNTLIGKEGVLRERNGVALTAHLVGKRYDLDNRKTTFSFLSLDGTLYNKRSVDKYWDFTVKAGKP